MPRRIPDYPDAFAGWNYISSLGSIISVMGTCLFIYIVYVSFTNESNKVNNNPWSVPSYFSSSKELEEGTPYATTLEFAVITPTPSHVYNVLPILTENALENNLLSDKTSHTAGVSLKIKDLIVFMGTHRDLFTAFGFILILLSIGLKIYKIFNLTF